MPELETDLQDIYDDLEAKKTQAESALNTLLESQSVIEGNLADISEQYDYYVTLVENLQDSIANHTETGDADIVASLQSSLSDAETQKASLLTQKETMEAQIDGYSDQIEEQKNLISLYNASMTDISESIQDIFPEDESEDYIVEDIEMEEEIYEEEDVEVEEEIDEDEEYVDPDTLEVDNDYPLDYPDDEDI
jgi:chromosome segregation ATPase